ncbi:uncharacterized protein PGTG_21310 [Puccinia graminis f. sp. tritici CRL 75-36-700-3]|uniref:Uncharacterized protein n=1 Tax=Puccinia graminis f. sp. tritici (strain CRL 75-36-700-3 / race SCCL) TaxID=418459 RepID=H6QR43_PUCGT|nr:uncharacterized protein PGTG_21310 [Puccinia graminis f. sp. tritici CRL 75-36-700-3]EHS63018.1 hypothetical protein PGTG_21310 [Puccinia graminis f. sp. tritici CRL 75-36-700-3]
MPLAGIDCLIPHSQATWYNSQTVGPCVLGSAGWETVSKLRLWTKLPDERKRSLLRRLLVTVIQTLYGARVWAVGACAEGPVS